MKSYLDWKNEIIKNLLEDDNYYFEFEYGTYDETFDMSDLESRARYLIDSRPDMFPCD